MSFASTRSTPYGSRDRLRHVIATVVVAALLAAGCGDADDTSSVFFIEPVDGAVVASPVDVKMGASGFTIEPAQEGVGENRGHFHIMIDAPCVEARLTVGTDDRHRHFGKGQATASLDLEPGTHTLCLQAADGVHTAKDIVDVITITVKE